MDFNGTLFLQLLLNGLIVGTLYALVAMCFSLAHPHVFTLTRTQSHSLALTHTLSVSPALTCSPSN